MREEQRAAERRAEIERHYHALGIADRVCCALLGDARCDEGDCHVLNATLGGAR